MSGVPGTTLVRRRNTAAPAPAAEAAASTEATAPLPDVERAALAALQRELFEAHKLYFKVTGVGVVSGGRFQVSLACPDSEWLDPRRNVFECGRAHRPGRRAVGRMAARSRWQTSSVKACGYFMRGTGNSRAPLPRFWADCPIVGQFPDPTAEGADVAIFVDQGFGANSATLRPWHDPCDKGV